MTTKLAVPSVLLILCGGALLVAAVFWARFKNPRDYWNEDQARTMARAGNVYHAAASAASEGGDEASDKARLAAFEKSKQDYEQEKLAFERARERFERPLRLMRWSGTAFLVVGILAFWLTRGSDGA